MKHKLLLCKSFVKIQLLFETEQKIGAAQRRDKEPKTTPRKFQAFLYLLKLSAGNGFSKLSLR